MSQSPALISSQNETSARPILEGLVVEHEPITLLGRFFLIADAALSKAGVTLVRTSLEAAAQTQAANRDSWALFPPMLDTRLSTIPEEASYGLLGIDAAGDVVCVQGGRVYDAGERSLADLVADQSFIYGTAIPPAPDFPYAEISAPSARIVRGRFVYSGALWVHPDYRGKGLAGILPRFSRCYARAKWGTEFTMGIINEQALVPKLLKAYGYNRIEPRLTIRNFGPSSVDAVVLLMDRSELEEDLARFVKASAPQINGTVGHGSTQYEVRTASDGNR